MPWSWKSVVYWLAPHGFLILISYNTQNHLPRNGTAHSELDLPISITQENALTWPQAIRCRYFLNWDFFFYKDSSVCHSDKKISSTDSQFNMQAIMVGRAWRNLPQHGAAEKECGTAGSHSDGPEKQREQARTQHTIPTFMTAIKVLWITNSTA